MMDMKEEIVFLASPSYDGRIDSGTAESIYGYATEKRQVAPKKNSGSLLSSNCNALLVAALNASRVFKMKWFAMLHADIEPEPFWLDKLIDIAESRDADLVSALVPLKDDRGLTSTGIGTSGSRRVEFRLTQSQLHSEGFPATFSATECLTALDKLPGDLRIATSIPDPILFVNTGCFIVRLDRDWMQSGKVWFSNDDWIEMKDGQWRTRCFSEDWKFSQLIHDCGGLVLATQAVKVTHKGNAIFPSDKTWGIPNDCGHIEGAKAS